MFEVETRTLLKRPCFLACYELTSCYNKITRKTMRNLSNCEELDFGNDNLYIKPIAPTETKKSSANMIRQQGGQSVVYLVKCKIILTVGYEYVCASRVEKRSHRIRSWRES